MFEMIWVKKRNVGENANWYSHYGEPYGGSFKT